MKRNLLGKIAATTLSLISVCQINASAIGCLTKFCASEFLSWCDEYTEFAKDFIEKLTEDAAYIDDFGNNILKFACCNGKTPEKAETIQKIFDRLTIENKAKLLNYVDCYGYTALDYAKNSYNPLMIKFISDEKKKLETQEASSSSSSSSASAQLSPSSCPNPSDFSVSAPTDGLTDDPTLPLYSAPSSPSVMTPFETSFPTFPFSTSSSDVPTGEPASSLQPSSSKFSIFTDELTDEPEASPALSESSSQVTSTPTGTLSPLLSPSSSSDTSAPLNRITEHEECELESWYKEPKIWKEFINNKLRKNIASVDEDEDGMRNLLFFANVYADNDEKLDIIKKIFNLHFTPAEKRKLLKCVDRHGKDVKHFAKLKGNRRLLDFISDKETELFWQVEFDGDLVCRNCLFNFMNFVSNVMRPGLDESKKTFADFRRHAIMSMIPFYGAFHGLTKAELVCAMSYAERYFLNPNAQKIDINEAAGTFIACILIVARKYCSDRCYANMKHIANTIGIEHDVFNTSETVLLDGLDYNCYVKPEEYARLEKILDEPVSGDALASPLFSPSRCRTDSNSSPLLAKTNSSPSDV